MPGKPSGAVLHLIRGLAAVRGVDGLADAELVRRFAREHSEAAFGALLRRHGPMVLRLCRRLLGHEQDAEDVFQATFLVLAEKAGSLRKSAAVGPWLFGVAARLARKHRAGSFRRRTKEQQAPDRPAPEDPLDRISVREAERILHEELAGLPERYRSPLVLCYLEGKTRDEAARELGYPLGTFKDRLERARHRLQQRLIRRGVGLTGALVSGLLTETPAPAAVSGPLARGTIRAAIGLAAGRSVDISARVGALAAGGRQVLLLARVKIFSALALTTLLVGSLAGLMLFSGAANLPSSGGGKEPPGPDPNKPAKGAVPEARRVDALGDLLPPGALMRLGTRRHHVQGSWQDLPDGRSYLTYLGSVREIRRLDAASGRILETWSVPYSYHPAGFSPDGRRVLLTNNFIFYTGLRVPGQKEEQQWVLTLYDLAKRKAVWQQSAKLEQKDWKYVDSACFSADGKWIVTTAGFPGASLRLWDGTTGKELWCHKSQGQSLEPLGFIDGNKTLVLYGTNDHSIYLFDRTTGKPRRSFPTVSGNGVGDHVLAPDGKNVLVGTGGKTVRVWDIATGRERPPLAGHQKWAARIAFARDGKTVVTGGGDQEVLVRAWPSGKVVRRIEVGRGGISRMAVSADGRRLEVWFGGGQALHLFDLATGKPIPAALEAHEGGVIGVVALPDGKVRSFGRDGTVRTWDPRSGKEVARVPVKPDLNGGRFAASADGRWLAAPSTDNSGVWLYERATGKKLRRLPAAGRTAQNLTFSPDGRWLKGTDGSGDIQVWAVADGRTVLKAHYQVAYGISCAFSPDSRKFVASDNGLVRIWDAGTWKEQPGLRAFAPLGLAFSPDGRTLVTASVEGVRLFEVATRGKRAWIPPPRDYPSGTLQFSPTGRWLAWVGNLGLIHVWDVYRGNLLGPFTGHDDAVTGLAFTADERALVSSSDDSTLLVWDLAGAAAKEPLAKPGDVDQAWRALANGDTKAAYDAICVLASSPTAALKRMARDLKPAAPADAAQVAACLRDLDSRQFAVRQRATKILSRLGDQAVPALERFLAGNPSAEARRRAEQLLFKARDPIHNPERLRQLRALEALERMGRETAEPLLERLAKGAPEAGLTRDAKEVLRRLRGRP